MMKDNMMKDRVDRLRKLLDIQGDHGNWNFSQYMHGMYNGIEFALALMEDRDPKYRNEPNVWLCDLKSKSTPTCIRLYLICA